MTILAFLASAEPAFAWGTEGHEIVAAIAARELTPRAASQVAQLLGGDPQAVMVHDSNWADEIRDQRPDTGRWHYVSIPLGSRYDAARDCLRDDCVVAQIERDEKTLANARLPRAQRAEALMFLIHFVADIHQPLHAADNDDRGGNSIHVWSDGQRTNLHHVWDMLVVEPLGPDATRVAATIMAQAGPAQMRAWQSGTPADWANDSLHLAERDIYPMVRDRHTLRLPDSYYYREAGAVEEQLAKAGTRLAWRLNTILK